jgi:TldD protein
VKLDTLREIDAFARALDPRVVQVSASLAASPQEVEILRPEGALVPTSGRWCAQRLASSSRRTGAARAAARRRRARRADGCWSAATGEGGARGAADRAGEPEAEDAPAGVMDVALGPGWPGILLHEAVGTGWRAISTARSTSAFAGLMGQRWPPRA